MEGFSLSLSPLLSLLEPPFTLGYIVRGYLCVHVCVCVCVCV